MYYIKATEADLLRLANLIESIIFDVEEYFGNRMQGSCTNIIVEPQVDGQDVKMLKKIGEQIAKRLG